MFHGGMVLFSGRMAFPLNSCTGSLATAPVTNCRARAEEANGQSVCSLSGRCMVQLRVVSNQRLIN